jgi:hypothetical protein
MDENDFDRLPLKPIEKRRFLEHVSLLKVVLTASALGILAPPLPLAPALAHRAAARARSRWPL